MPFNVSDPVLFYNKKVFAEAGLDPDKPPLTLDEVARRQPARSSTPARRRTASPSTPASTAAAAGTSSSGWPSSASSTPTTRTAARRGRPRCCTTTPTGVDLLTAGAVADQRRPGGQRRRQRQRPRQPAEAGRHDGAGGDDDRHLGGARRRCSTSLDGGQFPAAHAPTTSASGRCPGPDGRRARSSAGRRCGSPTRATPKAAAAWDFIKYLVGAQQQSTWSSATGYVAVRNDARDLEPLKTTFATDPRFKVAYDQLQPTRRHADLGRADHRPAARGPR